MADALYKIDADESDAVQAYLKFYRAQKKSEKAANALGAASRKASATSKSGMDRATSSLARYASGFVSAAAAASALRTVLTAINAERERGVEGLKAEATASSKLAQLAKGDEKRMGELLAAARKSRTEEGLTGEQSKLLQFEVESAGVAKKRDFFARLTNITATPEEANLLVQGAGAMKANFGRQAGSVEQIQNAFLAAALESPVASEGLAPVAAMAAPTVARSGGKMSELLAASAVLARATPTEPAVAGTQLRAFDAALAKKGVAHQGLLGGVDALKALGLDDQETRKFLGRKEAFQGFVKLQKQRSEIVRVQADVEKAILETGTARDLTEKNIAAKQKYFGDERLNRIATQKLALEEEKNAKESLRAETAIKGAKTESLQAGEAAGKRAIRAKILGAQKFLSPELAQQSSLLEQGPLEQQTIGAIGQAYTKTGIGIPAGLYMQGVASLIEAISALATETQKTNKHLEAIDTKTPPSRPPIEGRRPLTR